jgi:hypothetical protein
VGTEKRERQKANRALKHQQQVQAVARRKLYRKVGIGVAAVAALVLFVWISSNIVGGDDDEPVTPNTLPVIGPDTTIETTPGTALDSAPDTTEG